MYCYPSKIQHPLLNTMGYIWLMCAIMFLTLCVCVSVKVCLAGGWAGGWVGGMWDKGLLVLCAAFSYDTIRIK